MTDKPRIGSVLNIGEPLLRTFIPRTVRERLLLEAIGALRAGMGGHSHWDRSGRSGAGCEICQGQWRARGAADRLLSRAEELGDP